MVNGSAISPCGGDVVKAGLRESSGEKTVCTQVVQYQPRLVAVPVRKTDAVRVETRGGGRVASHSSTPRRRGAPSLTRKAEALILREGMFPPEARCLIMVSGGQDSLALLRILAGARARKAYPTFVHALHVNHHLRGEESDADEALVVRACGSAGVGLTVVHSPIEKARGNVQEEAREARRSAAMTAAREHDCDRIALGHTADDQVETMLYRLGRYGGLSSFSAMLACDPPWVRPLLGCRREETAEYCLQHRLEFARDRGNAYPGYARTALREQVVPAWEKALPGAVEAACRAADVAAEAQEVVAAAVAAAATQVARGGETAAECPAGRPLDEAEWLSVPALLALTPAVRRLLLHAWLEGRARPAASRAGVLAVESLLTVPGSAERSLGGGRRAVKEYERLFLDHRVRTGRAGGGPAPAGGAAIAPPAEAVVLPVPGETEWHGSRVRAECVSAFRMPEVAREAFFDAASLSDPLVVRAVRPGDRMRAFGAPGSRKVHDIFVDLRVPAAQRAVWPLVSCGRRIVWVCGLLQAEEGRITEDTSGIVRLSWERT